MNDSQIKELVETTARSKMNTKRIESLEEQYHLMHEMNKNIAVIAEQTKDTKEAVQSLKCETKEEMKLLKCDVEEIKSKPNKLIDKTKEQVIVVIVGTLVGAILALIFF